MTNGTAAWQWLRRFAVPLEKMQRIAARPSSAQRIGVQLRAPDRAKRGRATVSCNVQLGGAGRRHRQVAKRALHEWTPQRLPESMGWACPSALNRNAKRNLQSTHLDVCLV